MVTKYVQQTFSLAAMSKVLEVLAKQLGAPSPEVAALEASAHALLFIFAPPAGFVSPEGRVLASPEEIVRDMERGHTFVAALAPWIEEVKKRNANQAQLQFLHDIGLDGAPDEETSAGDARSTGDNSIEDESDDDGEEEHETPPLAVILPEPAHAAAILEGLLPRYDAQSAGHACIELALNTLQFLLDTKQVDAFCAFLDEIHRPHSPTGEDAQPVLEGPR